MADSQSGMVSPVTKNVPGIIPGSVRSRPKRTPQIWNFEAVPAKRRKVPRGSGTQSPLGSRDDSPPPAAPQKGFLRSAD